VCFQPGILGKDDRIGKTVTLSEQTQKDPPSRSREGRGCSERSYGRRVYYSQEYLAKFSFSFLSAWSSHLAADYSHDLDGIKVGMVRKCHFTLLLPRFTNLSSSRFQRRNPSICFVSKAPCILVRIARIFAVPREPTTRRYHRVSVSSLSLGYL
jgi:hypothetical protein